MPLMEWNEEYNVGVTIIDRQHRKLVGLLNDLYEGIRQRKGSGVVQQVLRALVSYTEGHFLTEERLMKKHDYPEYARHKVEHDALVIKVEDFQKKSLAGKKAVSVEVLLFLRDWLNNHILGTDKKFAAFFLSKGIH
jgi:hemerythrin